MNPMNKMVIQEEFKLLTLGPWTLYKPEAGTYVWIVGETYDYNPDPSQDNYIIMENCPDMKNAVMIFLEAMET